MSGPRLYLSEGLRSILDYPKFAGPTRMLILETDYFFDKSWQRAAKHLGWECATVGSAMIGSLSRDDIQNLFLTIGEFKPHFILTSNYAGMDTEGLFSRFFEDARIPYVSWFTDTPRMILYGRVMHLSPYSVAATWERAYTPHFKALGFEHVHFMPLATDPELFDGAPAATFERNLAFVGNSMIPQTIDALEKHRHLPRLVEAAFAKLEAGAITRDNFAKGVDGVFDTNTLTPLNASERRNLELLINYEATRRQREALAKSLVPLGLEVRGDPHWTQVLENVGGQVGYFDDLAPFYRHTLINVNSTSLQMRYAVNQRVFDCPAAGGFLITDNQADIDLLFEQEEEIVTYASTDELRDKCAWFLKHPDARTPFIEKARQRVLEEHTHAHRLKGLETFLKERFA